MKLTAKQKRLRKEREKAERAAYQRGEVKTRASRKRKPQDIEPKRKTGKQATAYRHRSAEETAKLSREDLAREVERLWDDAYRKYRRLKEAGIANAATALYESEFAGMNPWENNVNKNRALAAMLRKWLQRKDTSVTKGKKNKSRMKRKFFKDFDEFFEEEDENEVMREFWETWDMFLEWMGGMPEEYQKYIEYFREAYLEWKQNPEMTMEEMFQNAKSKIMESYAESYESGRPFTNPLDV